MSMQSFLDFFTVFGNTPDLVQQFTSVNSADAGFNFMVTKGAANGYSFTTDDVQSGLLNLKQQMIQNNILNNPLGSTAALSPEAFRRTAETRNLTNDMGDAVGWEDGEAGATIGETLYSYWDSNADNWGAASPDPDNW